MIKVSRLPAPWLGTVVAAAMCILAPLWLIVSTSAEPEYPAWVGALIIIILSGTRFAWVVASRERHLYEMVFWLFVYVFLGLAPLVQLRNGTDPSTTPDIYHELDWNTVIVILVGAGCVIVGSWYANLRGRGSRSEATDIPVEGVNPTRTRIVAFAGLFLGVAYIFLIGPSSFLLDRTTFDRVRQSALGGDNVAPIVTAVVIMVMLVSLVAQVILRRQRRLEGTASPIAMIVVTSMVMFYMVNPVSSPRYVFGTVLMGFLATLGIYSTLKSFRTASIAAVLALVLAFPLAALFRQSTNVTLIAQSPVDSLTSGDFDAFAQINNTVLYVLNSGITWGNQALGVVLFWVPRTAWADKPIDTGVLIGQSRGYSFTNLSAPAWSELFINGGWPLLVIGMLILGYALRRADARGERVLTARGIPTVLGCILPFYLLILLRGSLLQAMVYLAAAALCAAFVRDRAGGSEKPHSVVERSGIRLMSNRKART